MSLRESSSGFAQNVPHSANIHGMSSMHATAFRRIAKGFGANAYDQVVTVIIQIVGVPILLHAWGAQLYGEWLILFAIPAYLSITDLGFSQSAGNDMTARVVRHDRAGALNVFQSLAVLVYAGSAVGLGVTTAVLWLLPFDQWLHFKMMGPQAVRLVLWLAAAEMFVRLPNGVNDAGFRAGGDYALHVSLTSTARLLQFATVWIAALRGGGPVSAAIGFFGVRLLATPLTATLLVYRHQWLRFSVEHARKSELRPLLKPALANLALPFAQAVNIQGMVLVVGAVLGPVAVVVFSTLRTLTRLALQVVLAVSNAAEPEIAAAHGAGNRELMRSLFMHVLRGGMWLGFAAAAALTLFGRFILRHWTHGNVEMHGALFALLLASAVASVLWYGSLIVLKAANCHLRAAVVFVFASVGAVGVAALLLRLTGDLAASGLALICVDGAMAFYTIHSVARLLDVTTSSILRAANPYLLLVQRSQNPIPLVADQWE